MKKLILLTFAFSTVLTSCNDCHNEFCCNPETSKLYISQYLNDWFPYAINDSIKLTSQSTAQLMFKVDDLTKKDTGYFQGDECPQRPGEFRSGEISLQSDTLFFTTNYGVNSFLVEIDQIKFAIGDYPNDRQVNSVNQTTIVEMKESEIIVSTKFQDLIVAQSDSGNIQKIYLSNGFGLVGIERNDTIYELK